MERASARRRRLRGDILNQRDYNYIEGRLLAPTQAAQEAAGRLRQVGQDELADRVLKAAAEFHEKIRWIRSDFRQANIEKVI